MNWDNVKGDCVIGGREGKGNRKGGNYRISAKNPSHAESSLRLKEFTEGVVTSGLGDSC